jgi:AcrR family transcriptional regulator
VTLPFASNDAVATDTIPASVIQCVAEQGYHALTLRMVAKEAHVSTATIFGIFDKKANMIAAAMEAALVSEVAFHDCLALEVEKLDLAAGTLSDFILWYIDRRKTDVAAIFSMEVIFHSRHVEGATDFVVRWLSIVENFWNTIVGRVTTVEAGGQIIAAYSVIELAYTLGLDGELEYSSIRSETARCLANKVFAAAEEPGSEAIDWALNHRAEYESTEIEASHPMRDRLLAAGVSEILAEGVGGFNLRRVAKNAGTSLSMITYHFKDGQAFLNRTIWQALWGPVPSEVDPRVERSVADQSLDGWIDAVASMIAVPDPDAPGYYVGVARLIGQAALAARRHPELAPLIRQLRRIAGAGTFNARSLWQSDVTIGRSAAAVHGLWIKGRAILNEATGGHSQSDARSMLSGVISLLVTPSASGQLVARDRRQRKAKLAAL